MKIMIIDNDPDFGSVFARLLRIKGFDVTMKTNLKAGLSYFKNKTCHVLFIDVPLVGYDIKQILYLLEKNHLFQKSNIFLFSSIDLDTDEVNEWKKHGLYSYLKKPVSRDVILNALNDVYVKMTHTMNKNTVESHIDEDNMETNDDDKEATLEQIQKVNQLEQQVKRLENMQQLASSIQQHSSQEEQTILTSEQPSETTTVKKSSKDDPILQNVINNLSSLPSKHNSDEYLPKSPIPINSHEQGIIKKELEQTILTSEQPSETTTVKKSSKDYFVLQNVINNLRSLPSKHNSEEYLPKSPILGIQK
jgi:DNA-binding response OmpR family regulator